MAQKPDFSKIPVGISSCLLGDKVRYNGGHSYDAYIDNHLMEIFDFVPVCPEVGIGMGIPRDPICLVKIDQQIHVQGIDDPTIDVTDQLRNYGRKTAKRLNHLCGYIFKSHSPSCGMHRVKTYNGEGKPAMSDGVGAFAEEIMQAMPNLPVADETRLNDPMFRNHFIQRVSIYAHWKKQLGTGASTTRLDTFHAQFRQVIAAHNQAACKRLEKLVLNTEGAKTHSVCEKYETELMAAMKHPANNQAGINEQGFLSSG